MTTKWLKPGHWLKPNNGKLSNILKGNAYKQKAINIVSVPKIDIETKAQLESQNSEIKTISDHKKQVSKKATVKTSLKIKTLIRH